MKVSIALSQRLGARTLDHARRVEELGFDGVFVFDHLVPLGDPTSPALEASASLGALAAELTGRVGSLVLRATLRPPAVTAALAATVAAVSSQSPIVGLGAGDRMSQPETERFGLPFPALADRFATLAATVEAVRRVGVTTWVGGMHPAVAEIASRADGWNLWEPDPAQVGRVLDSRPTSDRFTMSWGGRVHVGERRPGVWLSGSGPEVTARLRQLAGTGFDEVVLAPLPPTDPSALTRLAAAVELVGDRV